MNLAAVYCDVCDMWINAGAMARHPLDRGHMRLRKALTAIVVVPEGGGNFELLELLDVRVKPRPPELAASEHQPETEGAEATVMMTPPPTRVDCIGARARD